MKLKNVGMAAIATVITIAAITAANTFLGQEMTMFICCVVAVFFFFLTAERAKPEREVKVEVATKRVTLDDFRYCLKHGFFDADRLWEELMDLDDLKFRDYAELSPEQQVMKSEENELRTRLVSTIDFVRSDDFKKWTKEKREQMLEQLGGMVIYHSALLTRCAEDGCIIVE